MDITVYIVRENKCPSCGMKGSYFSSKAEQENRWGKMVSTKTTTYQCHNSKVHTDQILFAVRHERVR